MRQNCAQEDRDQQVQGQGEQFAGLVGSAQLKAGDPPLLEARLVPQVTLNR